MIYIVAKREQTARMWAGAQGVRDADFHFHYRYVRDSDDLRGLALDTRFVLVGDYWLHRDWSAINRMIHERRHPFSEHLGLATEDEIRTKAMLRTFVDFWDDSESGDAYDFDRRHPGARAAARLACR